MLARQAAGRQAAGRQQAGRQQENGPHAHLLDRKAALRGAVHCPAPHKRLSRMYAQLQAETGCVQAHPRICRAHRVKPAANLRERVPVKLMQRTTEGWIVTMSIPCFEARSHARRSATTCNRQSLQLSKLQEILLQLPLQAWQVLGSTRAAGLQAQGTLLAAAHLGVAVGVVVDASALVPVLGRDVRAVLGGRALAVLHRCTQACVLRCCCRQRLGGGALFTVLVNTRRLTWGLCARASKTA